jgi:hypothetical protein
MFNPFSSLTTISNQEGKKRGRFTVAQIEQFNALAPSCKIKLILFHAIKAVKI